MGRRFVAAMMVMTLAALLAGCDTLDDLATSIFGDTAKEKLPGERVSVLSLDRRLEPDPTLANKAVSLPQAVVNPDWAQPGGVPAHVMGHLALNDDLHKAWTTDIGDGASRYGRIAAQPVVASGRIFGLDARDVVFALDAKTGSRLWENDVKPEAERDHSFGGGVAVAGDRVFVTTGYGHVLALDAATGREIWRQAMNAPMRGPPTVADGRVFAITVENQLQALSASDGHLLWSHSGLPEPAGLLGGASPAVEGDTVIAPYTSGEIFALRTENGRALWTDNLATARPVGALSTLADIRGRPVIDHGRVYAVSHSGRMLAIDLRTGARVWEQEIGGTQGPWVVGDYIYVLSNDTDLLCLTRDGGVRWVRELPRFEDEVKRKRPLRWAGPVLAGNRLLVVATNGTGSWVSPYTGEVVGKIEFPDDVFVDPIVADDTLYVLTDGADLIALR